MAALLKESEVKNDLGTLFAGSIDIKEIKDFLLKRPLGFLVLITNDVPEGEYKIFCMNSLRLHYCQTEGRFYEVVDGDSLAHSLDSIKYYDFIPHDNWAEVDTLKKHVCSHLTDVLVDSGRVKFTRKTRYFYGVSMRG